MKKIALIILMLSTFILFADEFDSNLNYIKNDILVGEGNFKIGFNVSYGYYESDNESKNEYTSYSLGNAGVLLPYQPMSSGIFAIYGINDSLQAFVSFNGYRYSEGSSVYNKYEYSVIGGSPFIGVTYGMYIEDIILSISPYISVPFYEKYKDENKEDEDDRSFEQYYGYGFLLNLNYVKDNYSINGFINYSKNEDDFFINKYIIFGFDFGFILNSSNDKVKAGIMKETYDSNFKEDNPLGIGSFDLKTQNYYKVTLTYNFNINSNNAINLQAYYYLPTEDKEDTTNYGIAFQFEFK